MEPYLNVFLCRLHCEREVARADFPRRDSVDCRMATVSRFLPSMNERHLIDLALGSMALDRHSAAICRDRRTMENFSEHCTIERNCCCSRGINYCCSPKSCHHRHEKNCSRPRRNYLRRREKNCRSRTNCHCQRNCHLLAIHYLRHEKSFRRRAKPRHLRVPPRPGRRRGQALARNRE